MTVNNYSSPNRPCQLLDLGLKPYREVWELQKCLVQSKVEAPQEPDYLLLTEHPPVYTLGTGSTLDHIKFAPGFRPDLITTERGGEVTYHCPGQLVMYPILNLKFHQTDLHWYLRQLEQVLIDTIAHWDLSAGRIEGLTGVWIDGAKVAAIGIKVSRWITMHGCALNVCPDLAGFKQIVPCGIKHKPVGKLNDFHAGLTIEQVKPVLIKEFQKKFHFEYLSGLKPINGTFGNQKK